MANGDSGRLELEVNVSEDAGEILVWPKGSKINEDGFNQGKEPVAALGIQNNREMVLQWANELVRIHCETQGEGYMLKEIFLPGVLVVIPGSDADEVIPLAEVAAALYKEGVTKKAVRSIAGRLGILLSSADAAAAEGER